MNEIWINKKRREIIGIKYELGKMLTLLLDKNEVAEIVYLERDWNRPPPPSECKPEGFIGWRTVPAALHEIKWERVKRSDDSMRYYCPVWSEAENVRSRSPFRIKSLKHQHDKPLQKIRMGPFIIRTKEPHAEELIVNEIIPSGSVVCRVFIRKRCMADNEGHFVHSELTAQTQEMRASVTKKKSQPRPSEKKRKGINDSKKNAEVTVYGCLTAYEDFADVKYNDAYYSLKCRKQACDLIRYLCKEKAYDEGTAKSTKQILSELRKHNDLIRANKWRPAHVFRRKLRNLYDAIGRNKTKGLYWINP